MPGMVCVSVRVQVTKFSFSGIVHDVNRKPLSVVQSKGGKLAGPVQVMLVQPRLLQFRGGGVVPEHLRLIALSWLQAEKLIVTCVSVDVCVEPLTPAAEGIPPTLKCGYFPLSPRALPLYFHPSKLTTIRLSFSKSPKPISSNFLFNTLSLWSVSSFNCSRFLFSAITS